MIKRALTGLTLAILFISLFAVIVLAAPVGIPLYLNLGGHVTGDYGIDLQGADVELTTITSGCYFPFGGTTAVTNVSGYYSLTPQLMVNNPKTTCDMTLTITDQNSEIVTHDFTIQITDPINQGNRPWPFDGSTYIFDTEVRSYDTAPAYSNQWTNPVNPTVYELNKDYTFYIDWIDNFNDIADVEFDFDGTVYSFVAGDITRNVDTFSITLNNQNSGNYTYFWNAEDGNSNIETTPNYNYQITRVVPVPTFTVSPVSPVDYGTTTTATCESNNLEQTTTLERDGFNIDEDNGVPVLLNAGEYDFVCSAPQTLNYQAFNLLESDYTINRIQPDIHLSLSNGTLVESDLIVDYETLTTAFGWVVEGDLGATTHLYRNGVEFANPDTDTLNAATYTYSFTYDQTQNYETRTVSYDLIVDPIQLTLHIAVDGIEQDATMSEPATYTIFGWKTPSDNDEGTVSVYVNDVWDRDTNDGWVIPEAGVSDGTYVYRAEYLHPLGNYIASLVERTVVVEEDTEPPQWSNMLFLNNPVYEPLRDYDFSIEWTDNIGIADVEFEITDGASFTKVYTLSDLTVNGDLYSIIVSDLAVELYNFEWREVANTETQISNEPFMVTLTRDGTDIIFENNVPVVLNAGIYVYRGDNLGNQNYTVSFEEWTLTIVKADPSDPSSPLMHISIEGIEDNFNAVYDAALIVDTLGWKDFVEGNLELYFDGILLPGLTDSQTFNIGTYNYTLYYPETANYLEAQLERTVIITPVLDITPPIIIITSPNTTFVESPVWLIAETDETSTCYYDIIINPLDEMNSTGGLEHTQIMNLANGDYTYYVRCEDPSGNSAEASVSFTVKNQHTDDLYFGWSLISLPLIPAQHILTNDADLWGTNYIIEHYNASDQQWYRYDSSDVINANLTELYPDWGYWVYVDADRQFSYYGDVSGQRNIILYPGLNMVGWTSLDTVSIYNALYYISENVSIVEAQLVTGVKDVSVVYPPEGDNFLPGKGYFITMLESTNTTTYNETPWVYYQNIAPFANSGSNIETTTNSQFTLDGSGSYDLDGQIVSWEWNIGGTIKSGATITYNFGSTGSYTAELTVTDNEGATDTDTVTITISTPGTVITGGSGGSFRRTPEGRYKLLLTVPSSLTVKSGETTTITITVKNIGEYNIVLENLNINSDLEWVSFDKVSLDSLSYDDEETITATIVVPENKTGTQKIEFSVGNEKTTERKTLTLTIEAAVQSDDDDDTGGTGPTGLFIYVTENPLLSAAVGLLLLIIGIFVHYYRKGKFKGMFTKKPEVIPKESLVESDKYNIEYK